MRLNSASMSFIQFVSMPSINSFTSRFTSASRPAGSAPFFARSSIERSVSRSFSSACSSVSDASTSVIFSAPETSAPFSSTWAAATVL